MRNEIIKEGDKTCVRNNILIHVGLVIPIQCHIHHHIII